MSKTEWKLWKIFVVALGIFIIETVAVFTEDCDVYAASVIASEEITVETAGSPENGKIREMSGMPCINREQFERWYATYEQETGEEEVLPDTGTVHGKSETELLEHSRSYTEEIPSEDEIWTTESVLDIPTAEEQVAYSVNGETLNPELQALLYDALDRHGISYFWEIALAQCYQESHFNIYAINPHNNEDMGVLQYKSRYWDWNRGDIFDPAAQFELYAEQMAARLNAGLSAEECISRHKTSDYSAAVDWTYVQQVKQHLPMMEAIR